MFENILQENLDSRNNCCPITPGTLLSNFTTTLQFSKEPLLKCSRVKGAIRHHTIIQGGLSFLLLLLFSSFIFEGWGIASIYNITLACGGNEPWVLNHKDVHHTMVDVMV